MATKPTRTGSIKISNSIVKKVKAHRIKTGISIAVFVEQAIEEKFAREKITTKPSTTLTGHNY